MSFDLLRDKQLEVGLFKFKDVFIFLPKVYD